MKRALKKYLMFLMVFVVFGICGVTAAAASGVNVETHTVAEIRQFIANSGATMSDLVTYETQPSVTAPYSPGKLSEETLNSALAMVNQVRYIAGVSYNVTLNETYNEKAQAGALVNAVNDTLTHYPSQPSDMSDELYQLGYSGCGSSNLGWASYNRTLTENIVHGWMADASSASNLSTVGHRRWVINPSMASTGFGDVNNYTAMYAFDRTNTSASQTGVCWPAQTMPTDYFKSSYPWSISMGTTVDSSAVKVTLVRKRDNKTWTFSSSSADGIFYVNNDGYGQKGCIIFRPDGVGTYYNGDVFEVTITGLSTTVNYTVTFFNLEPVTSVSFAEKSVDITLYESGTCPSVTVLPSGQNPSIITYTSSDSSVVSVEQDGSFKALKVGTATITASCDGISGSYTVNVQPISLESAEIELRTTSYVYDGTEKEAEISSVTVNDVELIWDSDYTVSYEDNIVVGSAKIILTGIGNYTGTIEKEFTIEKADLATDCSVSEIESLTYTGEAQKPALTVTQNQKVLTEGTDYTVTYTGNTNAGTASAVLTGINNYTGTTTVTFEIEPLALTAEMIAPIDMQTYSGDVITPELTVKSGDTVLADGKDYTVEYSNNTNAGTANVTVTGKGNYTGTVETSFVIERADLAEVTIEAIEQQVYAAAEITPAVSAKYNNHTLIKDTDYSVTYEDNRNAGTATVTVTGKGNYTGTYQMEFVITPADLGANCTTDAIEAKTYTGTAWTPEVSVTGTLETLVKDTDYTVSYADNTNAGTAYVTLTGINNYRGTITKTFEIKPVVLTVDMVETIGAMMYSGEAIIPEITVKTETTTLANGTDYAVTYSNNTNVGTASAAVTGKGNYTGEIGVLFDITEADINDAVFAEIQNQKYTGNAVMPEISAKYNNHTLIKDTDYSVTYEDNTVVGTAKVTIVGSGNFNGTVEKTFVIEKADISAAAFAEIGQQLYTGEEITPAVSAEYNGYTLEEDTDYSVTYEHNIKAGTAGVIVAGRGNFDGTITLNFAIRADLAGGAIAAIADQTYCAAAIEPAAEVSFEGEVLTAADYDIVYQDNTTVGTAKVTVTGKGKYIGSLETTFVIVPADLKANCTVTEIADQTYTGSMLTPAVTVSGKLESLVNGSDYTITYVNSQNVGTATVVLTGKGNYTGTASVSFNIVEKDTAGGSTSGDAGSTSGGTADSGTAALAVGTEIKNTAANAYFTVTGQSENGITEVQYAGPVSKTKTAAVIPATVTSNGVACKVTSIAANAFRNNKKLKSVTIGKNVTSIGNNAFYGCTKLSKVTIGSNVKTIGTKAFYKCTALKTIKIPSKVTKIGKQAFYGCKNLKTITIKTTKLSKKTVGSKAFTGIYKKATIKVPKSRLKTYKSMLKARGVSSKAKIRK